MIGTLRAISLVALSIVWASALSRPSVGQAPTLRSIVRRVGVDIVVTDAKGNAVTGLTQEDFSVEEDRVPQPVRTFELHTVAADRSYAPLETPQLPPNTFLNVSKSPESGTPTVILFDSLSTPLDQQNYARQELIKFIKRRRPGTPIAIFVLGERLHLLQGFTDDTDLLMAALASKTAKQRALALHPSNSAAAYTKGGYSTDPDLTFQQVLRDFTRMDQSDQPQMLRSRGNASLAAMIQIGRFLATVPGRKNLIWLSSHFNSGIFRSQDPHFSANYTVETMKGFREAANLLSLSDTAIYPVDVQGVRAIVGCTWCGSLENAGHMEMDLIADSTGGRAFYGTNDLREAMDRAIVIGSNYYSLTYEPTNLAYDGSLRHIEVTLKRPGNTLSYRRTYYADDLTATVPPTRLTQWLERGTPLARGLFLEAHLEADGPPVPATSAQLQSLSQYRTLQARSNVPSHTPPVMMQPYLISYGLIARQLDMPADETGTHNASLEFGVIAYDDDGRKLTGIDSHVDDTIPEPRYAKLVSDGYHVAQSVFVPVTAASIRFAVRDTRSNRMGSLEVKLPLAKVIEANAK